MFLTRPTAEWSRIARGTVRALMALALATVLPPAASGATEAETAFAAGDYSEAYRQAKEALEENQVDVQALLIAGMAGLRLANGKPRVSPAEAEEHFRMVFELAPDMPGIHYLLGFAIFRRTETMGRRSRPGVRDLYLEAAGLFTEELDRSTPNRDASLAGRAVALTRAGKIDEGIAAHEAWIAALPQNANAYLSLLQLLVTEKRIDAAVELVGRLSTAPEAPTPTLFRIGLECARDQEMIPVVGPIREAVTVPWARNALGVIHFLGSGRPDLAAAELRSFVSAAPPEDQRTAFFEHLALQAEGRGEGPGERDVDPSLRQPERVDYVPPEFPERARRSRSHGKVIALGIIGVDGTTELFWVSSNRPGAGFEEAAREAILQWRYRPGAHEGTPTEFFVSIRVEFQVS